MLLSLVRHEEYDPLATVCGGYDDDGGAVYSEPVVEPVAEPVSEPAFEPVAEPVSEPGDPFAGREATYAFSPGATEPIVDSAPAAMPYGASPTAVESDYGYGPTLPGTTFGSAADYGLDPAMSSGPFNTIANYDPRAPTVDTGAINYLLDGGSADALGQGIGVLQDAWRATSTPLSGTDRTDTIESRLGPSFDRFDTLDPAVQALVSDELGRVGTEFAHDAARRAGPDPATVERLFGAVRIAGGVGEGIGALALLGAPEPTGLTKPAGALLGIHAIDQLQAGARQLWYGEPTSSLAETGIARGLEAGGVSRETAERLAPLIDMGASIATPIAAASRLSSNAARMADVQDAFRSSPAVRFFDGATEAPFAATPGQRFTAIVDTDGTLVLGKDIPGRGGVPGGGGSHVTLNGFVNNDPLDYGRRGGSIQVWPNHIDVSGFHYKNSYLPAAQTIADRISDVYPAASFRLTGDRLNTLPRWW